MKTILIIAIAVLTFTACTKEIDLQGHYVTESYSNMGVVMPGVAIELTLESGNFYFYDPNSNQEATGTYAYSETNFVMNWGSNVSEWQYTFENDRLVLWCEYETWELVR